jgi:hypothetical protein
MQLSTLDLTQSKQWLSEPQRYSIMDIISASFSDVAPKDYLAIYFDSKEAHERKLRLYYDGSNLVGYCLLTFTRKMKTTVIGASAGFLPEYRQGGNTFQFSLFESFKCWLRSPWRNHYYADRMLSPAMYRAIAKNTGIIWPHFKHESPKHLFDRFNPDGEIDSRYALRCLVPIGRSSNYTTEELASLRTSNKPEIEYFCQVNPQFDKGVALFVIIPIHLRQFIWTLVKRVSMSVREN